MLNLEHIDPKKSHLVSGLTGNDYNEIIAEESYNKRKNNRFVPYRVCEHPAPVTFGDIGEFLIEDKWIVCEFGGETWWAESNRIGNAQVEAGKKGVKNQPREAKVLGGQRGTEVIREKGVGIYGLTPEEREANGRAGGALARDLGLGIHSPGVKTFETCSQGGKIGGAVTRDSGKLKETSRLGGTVQGPRNKGMAWYHHHDDYGNIIRKRSKTPLPAPWVSGKGKSK
jgi:hypothetical protein